jgi:HPt (histidine-containing phosphotransfer) domain-containing protein
MAQTNSNVAFDRPGGEEQDTPGPRPLDLAHLLRQALGDREVENEVLTMFVRQATFVRDQIFIAEAGERRLLAHGLKGAARGVGAFPVADAAGELEAHPQDRDAAERLVALIDEVLDFIASITR